jgi:acetyl esterase/lipase
VNPAARFCALAVALACLPLGAEEAPLRLWPGTAPGEKGSIGPEHDQTKPSDDLIAGRRVIRITDVSEPTLTVYRPAAGKDTGACVVVFPGGGYYVVAWDLEGTETCEWLNSAGVTAVLVKYRVPRREGRPAYQAPLEDAQRTMGIVRSRAREWGIDPNRVGVLGFSAGGDLCAVLSAHPGRVYAPVDAADAFSCHPDFQILVYPGYLAGPALGVAPEARVDARTPPSFLVVAADDYSHTGDLYAYAIALGAARIPLEAHVFPSGGHGFGLRPTADAVTGWPALAEQWMRGLGLLRRG